jgi:hypothetical protein
MGTITLSRKVTQLKWSATSANNNRVSPPPLSHLISQICIVDMKRTPHRNPGFISAQANSIATITRINFLVLRIIARIITPILGSISGHTTHRSPTPEPDTVVTVVVVVIVMVIVAAVVVTATVMTTTVTAAMAVRYGDRSALQNT